MADGNPRFAAYARAHGRTPEEQSAHDRQRFPGGSMAGFLTWNSARWEDWWRAEQEAGRAPRNVRRDDAIIGAKEHDAYDRFLAALATCGGCRSCTS